jgi:DNA-binding transcriptional LysR family regulator
MLIEGSVSKAADQLGVTQSAVSQALARARRIWGDELLVRHGQRMFPTPVALALLDRLNNWVADTHDLLLPAKADPSVYKGQITIISNDYSEVALLPPAIGKLTKLAPGLTTQLRSIEVFPMGSEEFTEGRIEFAIAGIPPPPGPFEMLPLFEERFVVIMRRDHPCACAPMTLDSYADSQHALVSPQGKGLTGPLDIALQERKRSRKIALSLTRFTSLPVILQSTDLIATVPSRFAHYPEVRERCCVMSLPFPSPTFTMSLIWHRRFSFDPFHRWARALLHEVIAHPM